MKVLVIGSGGREHALVWQLKKSPQVDKVYCAPGNAGIAADAQCVPIKLDELEKLADFAQNNQIDLTVVGPEAPLCAGVVDLFRSRNLAIFGPDKEAAQLEGSKDYAKRFMNKYNIPTAKSATFDKLDDAIIYVNEQYEAGCDSIVIKADGLAAGKGVLVANHRQAATDFVRECFEGAFGNAGAKVVIEECLPGEEASIFALVDGNTIIPLVSAQDHKRAFDGDRGPNTGGMGAYSPAPVVTPALEKMIDSQILQPFLKGINSEKLNYRGVVFVGLMINNGVPKVLEFNVRFGDPEIQPVLRRFSGDWFDVLAKTAAGKLAEAKLAWIPEPAVSVVMASGGYPGDYAKGFPITGLKEAAETNAVVFHCGTVAKGEEIVTDGGRVLGVSATGNSIREAIHNAYYGVSKIKFENMQFRHDIGAKALHRARVGRKIANPILETILLIVLLVLGIGLILNFDSAQQPARLFTGLALFLTMLRLIIAEFRRVLTYRLFGVQTAVFISLYLIIRAMFAGKV